jgi:hypothetical protein
MPIEVILQSLFSINIIAPTEIWYDSRRECDEINPMSYQLGISPVVAYKVQVPIDKFIIEPAVALQELHTLGLDLEAYAGLRFHLHMRNRHRCDLQPILLILYLSLIETSSLQLPKL